MPEQNPKYDGLYVYKIDVGKLKPGDVLLTRNVETTSSKGKLLSSLIMQATGGTFSHALLCTVPPTFIEAIGAGVSNLSAQNCFAHDLNNVRLLRYHNSLIAKNAGSEALPLLGQKYSIRGAIRSILPNAELAEVSDDKLFCSALVAAAFLKAGARELEISNPMKVTPATLEMAKYFVDVTDSIFQRILSPNNIEQMSALDGDRATSPLAGQAELFQEYCDVLLPMIEDFISSTPQLTCTKTPKSFLECVMFISAARDTIDALQNDTAGDLTKKLSIIDNAAHDLLADGRFEEMQKQATAIDEKSLQYTIEQSFQTDPDIDLTDTRALLEATKQQISSRSIPSRHRESMKKNRATKKWMEITEEFVDALRRRLTTLEEVFQRTFPGEKY